LLIQLLFKIKLLLLLLFDNVIWKILNLTLDLPNLLGSGRVKQDAFLVNESGGLHVSLDSFPLEKSDEMNIDELVILANPLLRVHSDAVQNKALWFLMLLFGPTRSVMQGIFTVW
jgi:hypothetical protein